MEPGIIVAMENPFPDADADRILGDTLTSLRAQARLGQQRFGDIMVSHVHDLIEDGLDQYVEDPELLPTDDPELLADWMAFLLDEEFAEMIQEQGEEGTLLDSERLTAAFTELDAAGILARENYTCCNTCATAELAGEAEQLRGGRERDGLPPIRGYVYYHQQDAERLMPGLGYGSYVADTPEEHTAVGREIVETMRRHGLTPGWNGDPGTKIEGPYLVRRRTGYLAWHPSAEQ